MKKDKTLPWIVLAYEQIAQQGFNSIKIEALAKQLNKNKSSFYHYFGDLDCFKLTLLDYHIEQATILSEKIGQCERIKPDILDLFLAHKTDIFFHKQLRIKREQAVFKQCYEQAFKRVEETMLSKWILFLQLNQKHFFAKAFLHLIADNFLLRITEQHYNYEWLDNYIEELRYLIQQLLTEG